MGKITGNVLGNVSGRVGGLVFAKAPGGTTVRTHQPNVRVGDTTEQVNQRSRMAVIGGLFKPMKRFLIGRFEGLPNTLSDWNRVVQINQGAVTHDVSGNPVISYATMKISEGTLDAPATAGIAKGTGNQVVVTYDTANGVFGTASDKATIIVYNETKKQYLKLDNVPTRSAGTATYSIEAPATGDKIRLWLCMTRAADKMSSNTKTAQLTW